MNTNQWQIVGNNIKQFRIKNGLTQTEVAKYLGLNNHTLLSYYENGERAVSVENLNKLANLFRVDMDILLLNDPNEQIVNHMFAFRKEEIKQEDLEKIASFYQIVKNYMKVLSLEKKYEKKS